MEIPANTSSEYYTRAVIDGQRRMNVCSAFSLNLKYELDLIKLLRTMKYENYEVVLTADDSRLAIIKFQYRNCYHDHVHNKVHFLSVGWFIEGNIYYKLLPHYRTITKRFYYLSAN